jgi:GNAT superfamily N-acetyltransferase
MTIRAATLEDADAVAELLGELGYPNDVAFAEDSIQTYSKRTSSRVLVAESDGRIVGFIAFDSQPLFHHVGNIGCIMALCVSRDARGCGVGHALVARIEEVAKELGCIKIAVASGLQRAEAHEFYLGLGYEENAKRFVKQLC